MAALSTPIVDDINDMKNHPTANLIANQQAIDELTEPEKQILAELRKTYIESTELEILQHKSIFEVEVCVDEAYKRIFDDRRAILEAFTTGPLKQFWIKVFKTAGILLSEDDEKMMLHLIDVRSKMHSEPKVKMVIEFEFDENPCFSNRVLSKTYYIKCHADLKNAVIYDGIEITSTEGTKINWLVERSAYTAEEDRQYSFFDFFDNHSDSENVNRAVLGEEIAFGFFLREKVIPKAIYFFTGDIRIQKLDTDSEAGEDEDEAEAICNGSEDEVDGDYDGDSEGGSETELTQQQYVELENEFDAKELADNEKEEEEQQQNHDCHCAPSEEVRRCLQEAEDQPLIDTGDES